MEGRNSIPKPQNNLDIPTFNASQMASHSSSHLSPGNNSNKRPGAGIPPSHPNNPAAPLPYSQHTVGSRPNAQQGAPAHSRSLSQPTFFSHDRLRPWCPPPSVLSLSDPAFNDVSMEERVVNSNVRSSLPSTVAGGSNEFLTGQSSCLPPPPPPPPPSRKGHRRSSSDDVPLGFSTMIQSSPQLVPPIGTRGMLDRSVSGRGGSFGAGKPIQLVQGESVWKKDCGSSVQVTCERKSEGDIADDLFSAYMNLENLETLNSFGNEDKDLDACESSENEITEGVNKRMASGDTAPIVRHYRSVSMDSYLGSLQFDEDPPKIPLANHVNHHSPGSSADANSSKFNFETGSSEFNESELKKIMENEKLAEMASIDPKRVKRILANRRSAARSKQRKMQYIVELEQKVQTLQTEITTLSAQITKLQNDYDGLSSQNNELNFRLQAMKQHAQLKDALNEALAAEAQRLKLTAAEFSGETHLSNCMTQQHSINHPMLRLQPRQLNVYQMQQQPQNSHNDQSQTQQQNDAAADDDDANESK
ncbi:hypothetical protein V6N13_048167 [Hibiscus sabdariffa]|uniref:BZIP domain-containing protein n=1 Tax=Hibiscus sabdariffa TaxID=183260 RepID=A0ABR2F6D6_9ROSI